MIKMNDESASRQSLLDTFVGRSRELGTLEGSLKSALGGNGRIDVIVGEPGIGKTRLAEELCRRASDSGVLVLAGRCYEEKGSPPYWAWIQVLRQCIDELGVEECRRIAGRDAGLCARLEPRFSDSTAQPRQIAKYSQQSVESDAFNLQNAISNFLFNVSDEYPLVIHLDDLHWADSEALRILVFASRSVLKSRIYIVGTYRDIELDRVHPLSDALADLARERSFSRIQMRGLAEEDVSEYIAATVGDEIARTNAGVLHDLTNGNPLFLNQLVQYAGERDPGGDIAGTFHALMGGKLPEGLRETIGRRLNRLSSDCNQMLLVMALVGHEASFRLIDHILSDWESERTIETLDEAVRARILLEISSSQADYAFCHPLVRETLAGELSIAKRVRLHARIVNSLEEIHGEHLTQYASQILFHAQQAEPILAGLKVAKYAAIAAENAEQAGASAAVTRYLSESYEILEDLPMDDKKAELLYRLIRCYFSVTIGFGGRANSVLAELYDYYESGGETGKISELFSLPGIQNSTAARQLANRSLKILPPASKARALALGIHGVQLLDEGAPEKAEPSFKRALEIADSLDDSRLKTWVLIGWSWGSHFSGDYQAALIHGEQALELAIELNEPDDEVWARYYIMDAHGRLGSPEKKDYHREKMKQRLLEVGNHIFSAYMEYQYGMARNVINGEWDIARQAFAKFEERPSPTEVKVLYLSALLTVEMYTGNSELAAWTAGQVSQSLPALSGTIVVYLAFPVQALSEYMVLTSNTTSAPEYLDACNELLESPESNARLRAIAHAALGLFYVAREDKDRARHHLEKLDPVLADFGWRHAGRIKHFLGDYRGAVECLRKAREAEQSKLVRTAWNQLFLGKALIGRENLGDADEALSLLSLSHETATRLGMTFLIEKIEEIQEWRSKESSLKTGDSELERLLTEREIDVLKLIAKGRTDKEIAAELYISIKTVSNHVGNILRKTDTGNRTEAASFGISRGIGKLS
jgi:DNA-binding CsgD family transcriptional regulator